MIMVPFGSELALNCLDRTESLGPDAAAERLDSGIRGPIGSVPPFIHVIKRLVASLNALAQARFGALTVAETNLLRDCQVGATAICGPNNDLNDPTNDPSNAHNWGEARSIRGKLIAWLCADRQAGLFVHHSGVQIMGATIVGPIELVSVPIQFPLVFASCSISDDINLQSARTRTLSFTQTNIKSIFADGANLSGAFFMRECEADILQFSGARIEGQFDCFRSKFQFLLLDGAVVGVGLLLRHAEGTAKMSAARIATDLDCGGATFTTTGSPFGCALDVEGASVEGSIFLRNGFRASGPVKLLGTQVGMNLDCTGGRFDAASDANGGSNDVLRADLIAVKGTVFLSAGFRAQGAVHFTSAQIGGDFNCDHGSFGTGLTIERANVQGAFFWRNVTMAKAAGLDIINTSVDALSDDSSSWPLDGLFECHGFSYRRIGQISPRSATERLDWLRRQKSFAAQPYQQLASVLKDEGDDSGARQVLYEMECLRRSNDTRVAQFWNFALRFVIGYGYRPWRALVLFVGLVLLGSLLFSFGFYAGNMVPTDDVAYRSLRDKDLMPDHYERFHPMVYSLENSLPLFKLGQVDRWQPDPAVRVFDDRAYSLTFRFLLHFVSPCFLRWYRWFQVLVGWFLATLWIAGVTGLIRRD
jgi:hypothetical protein